MDCLYYWTVYLIENGKQLLRFFFLIEFKGCFCIISNYTGTYLINTGWIRNFCLDPDPELGKFKAGSGSGINSFGSTTLFFNWVFSLTPVLINEITWRHLAAVLEAGSFGRFILTGSCSSKIASFPALTGKLVFCQKFFECLYKYYLMFTLIKLRFLRKKYNFLPTASCLVQVGYGL